MCSRPKIAQYCVVVVVEERLLLGGGEKKKLLRSREKVICQGRRERDRFECRRRRLVCRGMVASANIHFYRGFVK